ncbi:DUF7344 domain-containing protein [Natrinema marinum]|uniref:DUF7344 domain-containing protein n=1 Tax=Natrinema marinum TaxID=2961598 RepID=UPI0020C9118C|nr:hypothetical protein [Natrinema marinum]
MSRSRTETLEFSTIAFLLASETRRRTLSRLRTVGRTTTRDLGHHLAAIERGIDFADLEAAEGPRTVTIELHHDHLPRLDEHGVVEYDSAESQVETGPNFEEVAPIVQRFERTDSR